MIESYEILMFPHMANDMGEELRSYFEIAGGSIVRLYTAGIQYSIFEV